MTNKLLKHHVVKIDFLSKLMSDFQIEKKNNTSKQQTNKTYPVHLRLGIKGLIGSLTSLVSVLVFVFPKPCMFQQGLEFIFVRYLWFHDVTAWLKLELKYRYGHNPRPQPITQ